MRLGVIGCGRRAQFHLDEIASLEQTELVAVCDADPQRLTGLTAVRTFLDWRDMLAQVELDAAVIVLPPYLHAPAAIDCLQAGLHVLVENPLALTLDDADRLAEAARQGGRVLMVANGYRFAPACRSAHGLIQSGQIGEPAVVSGLWTGPRWMMAQAAWCRRRDQAGGGPLLGFGTHLFDLLAWLVGPIASVDAAVSSRLVPDVEVEDSAALLVRFQNGAAGSFLLSWADQADQFRLDTEILGTQGRVQFSPRGACRLARGGQVADVPSDKIDSHGLPAGRHGLYHEFLAAVEAGRPPLTNAATGRYALACTLAAYRSAELGHPMAVPPAAL